jgi:hypothetical protein
MGIDGLPELMLMVALPAAAFLLIEARTVCEMLGSAFGSGSMTLDEQLGNPVKGNA